MGIKSIQQNSKRGKGSMPKLMVTYGECPNCFHTKLLESQNLVKCAKCKFVIRRW